MSNRTELIESNGWKAYAYYALFPLDLFAPDDQERLLYQQTKLEELMPVLGVLLPVVVFLTGATTSLGFIQLVLFYSVEALLLAAVAKFHLKLAWNQTIEVWLNLWLAMLGTALAMATLAFFFGSMSHPEIDWG